MFFYFVEFATFIHNILLSITSGTRGKFNKNYFRLYLLPNVEQLYNSKTVHFMNKNVFLQNILWKNVYNLCEYCFFFSFQCLHSLNLLTRRMAFSYENKMVCKHRKIVTRVLFITRKKK